MDGKEIQTEILRNKLRTLSAMVYPICDELNVQPVHAVLLLLLELHLISNAQNIITLIVSGDQHENKNNSFVGQFCHTLNSEWMWSTYKIEILCGSKILTVLKW